MVTTYRDEVPNFGTRIVVQVYRKGLIGGWMAADGFIKKSDGALMPVPQEQLWEFL
jgi:hypothetical protein